ncbi:MAG: hypothetical protein IPP57_26705 [Candidatus Obscuribacter sp.]|mgnify:CR=1 FL=1|jgi:predicted transcriptional regulator|nr:hypothetical protein [Candidatus Obscuribacter sp.]MDQ5967096.1 hypothetical protein [Cyanobacteriota bacterium erpe_2018_sw_39hr_WHONDRS-SW48-000098_B_bin.30]MBK7836431.1 hypothetical protein [Candidatus Obscuribacter sp.]MBK9205785.1 hypothetical protein [Candidatus Obscuribacter sp.]MBK9617732.1 hypothetical protein [Candidatus Obscuribacter sp.]
MPVFEQPMRKLLGTLSTTITWLNEKGTVDVSSVPDDHLEAIKQLERIGVVHKRNNRSYELQKIRLKKLLGNLGIESLAEPEYVGAIATQTLPADIVLKEAAVPELN